MFVLSKEEANLLLSIGVSQNVIPPDYNFGAALPMAFTEQGVAMLSSVLRSQTAIEVNIFVLMRQMVAGYEELLKRIEELEASTDAQFNDIYQALTQLLSQSQEIVFQQVASIYLAGSSPGYPHFFIPFSSGTFPETPAVQSMADCFS